MARSNTTFKDGHILSDETKKKIGAANSGNTPWNKGKKGVMPIPWNKGTKLSDEGKKKLSNARKGFKMTQEQKDKISAALLGKKIVYKISKEELSEIRRMQFYKQCEDGNHPRWKGGITPLNEQIRHSFYYRQWRSDIFTRDEYTCQECLVIGGVLHAHHIKRFSQIIEDNNITSMDDAIACEELWNINNGITLCKSCHNVLHSSNMNCVGEQSY